MWTSDKNKTSVNNPIVVPYLQKMQRNCAPFDVDVYSENIGDYYYLTFSLRYSTNFDVWGGFDKFATCQIIPFYPNVIIHLATSADVTFCIGTLFDLLKHNVVDDIRDHSWK